MILKDARFWIGVLAGYLLVIFVPQVSFKNMGSKKGGGLP
jgi:hypothetical protein